MCLVSEAEFPPDAGDALPKTDGIGRGRLRRTAPLAALTARTAGEAVVVGLRGKLTGADSTEFHVRTAERYTELLGRSKGALMKAGQMLSFVSLGPVVGEEFQSTYQAALTRLRNDAPPMAPELAREALERELGRRTERTFAEFDWEPLAAASIGQVHAARLHDGRAVAAVNRFFTPRAVQRIRERVAAIVDSAFAPLAEGEPIELMSELAYPIPLAVIAELFDVGLEGAELLRSETPTLARMLELDPTPSELEAIGTAAMTLMLFLVPIVAQRRGDPGEDLLSALIHPPDGGVALETDEIITMCLLLLAAGHETTANLIGNGTLALLQHPDQLDWLARHPDLSAQAVDELLRYDSPAQVASRVARNDLVLGGTRVRKGQQALVVLGAANRDPARYPDPDRLDLTRSGPPHLAFGNGPHFCVGAGLARLEAQETFTRLAQSALRPKAGSWSHSRDHSRTFRRLRSLRIADSQPPDSERTLGAVPVS
jgi:cytochrome P450